MRPAIAPAPPAEAERSVVAVVPPVPAASQPSFLRVIQMSPTSRTFNYPDTPIEVVFSQPVNPLTVPAAFHVTPPREGTLMFPAPDRLVFRPRQLWERGTTYLVTLDEGISGATSLDQLDRTSWDFSIVSGYFYTRDIRPLISAYCTPCHQAGEPAARIPLDDLAATQRFVQPDDAEHSRLLAVLADPNHQGKIDPQVRSKLYIFRDWIQLNQAGD